LLLRSRLDKGRLFFGVLYFSLGKEKQAAVVFEEIETGRRDLRAVAADAPIHVVVGFGLAKAMALKAL
jgi:hypothetical protein